ncbi:MAG: hypothetical protein R3282_10300, partial [Rhodothermales bacterium]|nr:hypothetical protein [Rhodothermales bacterium]
MKASEAHVGQVNGKVTSIRLANREFEQPLLIRELERPAFRDAGLPLDLYEHPGIIGRGSREHGCAIARLSAIPHRYE